MGTTDVICVSTSQSQSISANLNCLNVYLWAPIPSVIQLSLRVLALPPANTTDPRHFLPVTMTCFAVHQSNQRYTMQPTRAITYVCTVHVWSHQSQQYKLLLLEQIQQVQYPAIYFVLAHVIRPFTSLAGVDWVNHGRECCLFLALLCGFAGTYRICLLPSILFWPSFPFTSACLVFDSLVGFVLNRRRYQRRFLHNIFLLFRMNE
ncbi:hypothetical protein GGR54DRAFT_462501 [Hypoxylon sp. NC1633]|nr:hypothetical protein GGR54DRAFT_462501 [Hypoxylon sp. NC1633]